jgi:transglutaminase-like putative cysteine protease
MMRNTTAALIALAAVLVGCATPAPCPTTAATEGDAAPTPVQHTEVPSETPTHTATPTPAATLAPQPTCTPTATATPLPTPTPTPRPWQTYQMEYAVRIGGVSKLWMPVPRGWDGVGMTGITVVDISPPPTDRYQDANGNEIAFWQIGDQNTQTYRVVFDVMVQPIYYDIDPTNIGEYDVTSPLYQRYTQPISWVQSDDPEIAEQAQEIVGSETNPYSQARLLHRWVAENIASGKPVDALTALRTRSGDCGPHSFLLVAFLRALGIPARPVTGLSTIYRGVFETGSSLEGARYGHVWTEFYLPNHGWIQCDADAGGRNFGQISEPRIVLSRGDVIELGHGYPLPPLAWLHSPHPDIISDSTPPTQTWGEELSLTVERVR